MIETYPGKKDDVKHCNNCSRPSSAICPILIISLPYMSFALCWHCYLELFSKMATRISQLSDEVTRLEKEEYRAETRDDSKT